NVVGCSVLLRDALLTASALYGLILIADSLECTAALAAATGQWERALLLAGAAETLRERSADLSIPHRHTWLARALDPARAALSAEEAASVLAAGRNLSVDAAVALALIDGQE
ncbi:MAG: hypothetical protein ACRD1H_07690, partial [Vicinamibacterales bacterium]